MVLAYRLSCTACGISIVTVIRDGEDLPRHRCSVTGRVAEFDTVEDADRSEAYGVVVKRS